MSDFTLLLVAIGFVAIVTVLYIDFGIWSLDHQSNENTKYIASEVARTRKVIENLGLQQMASLNASVHEACVTLIVESFNASQTARKTAPVAPVAKTTTTSSGAHRRSPAQGD